MDIIKVHKKNHAFLHVECEPSVANELTDFFTFFVPGYKFMPAYKNKIWDGKIRLFDSRKKELYAGLFTYLQEFANAEGRDYRIELEFDNYYGLPGADHDVDMSFIKDLNLTAAGKPIEPRDYQLRAVEHGLTKKAALLISPTASGKSLIIYLIIRYLQSDEFKKGLLIVPTTSLVEQMYTDFKSYGYDSELYCHRQYSGKEKTTNKFLTITTWQSI